MSIITIVLLLLLTPGQGFCGPIPRPGSGPSKTTISIYMGLGFYNMGDINNLIDGENDVRGGDYIDHITLCSLMPQAILLTS